MLKSQQEAARLRREATEKGFEINVYVPLGLVERKQQQRRQLDEYQDRENVYKLSEEVIVEIYEHDKFLRQVIAQQAAGDKKHIAIIGEPGAGKTTLLSTIASFVEKIQDLVICISLANLQGKTIEEYLLKQWLPEAIRLVKSDIVITLEIERQLIECFGKGGVWLLLDGVDEMGEISPVQALAKINQELTASLRQARVVLTCRLNVWDAKVNNTLSGFNTYKTQEFKPEQIDDFIQQWFEYTKDSQKGERLKAKLKEPKHENIRKLVTNPLRLSLLCQTFYLDKQGELPETKAALYQRFTRYFYEWKSESFPELYQSDNLKDKLHHVLSKLAFAGINSSARFRLRRSLARQEMGEELFKLARDVSWLNLVDRVTESDEEVYAFFHPNFQEYFAALMVSDWHDFLNHVPDNPKGGTYRIFESQWREVILLWLGRREETIKEQQQKFIDALVNFRDGCGKWNRKRFYEYQAYFLAAAGIAELRGYSKADKIVAQIVKWAIGYLKIVFFNKKVYLRFDYFIAKEANLALQQTDRTKVIAALVQLLQSTTVDDSTRRQAASSLRKIGTGNEIAIAALVQLLQSTTVDYYTRSLAASSLGEIDPGNEIAIAALVQLLQSTTVDDSTRRQAAYSLGEIGTGNEIAIAALVQLLQSTTVDYYTRSLAAYSLRKIGTGNEIAIAALVQLLQSTTVDDETRWQGAYSLGEIDPGNEIAIAALVQLLQSTTVDDETRSLAALSLGKIDPGNEIAIAALMQLLQSTTVDNDTRSLAALSLREIGTGNEIAIAALVQLLQSTTGDDETRSLAALSLGKIGPGNEIAIATLVQLLQSTTVDDETRRQAAKSLGEIGTGNEIAIAALVQLLQSTTGDDSTRRQAASSLGEIGTGNEIAIAALVQLLQSTTVDYYTRSLAAYSLRKIGTGNEIAIAALVQLLQSTTVDDEIRWQGASSLGEIGTGNEIAIAALVQLLQSTTVDDETRWQGAYSLEKIGTGNEIAIAALMQLLQSTTVDNDTRWLAAYSLEKIDPGNEFTIAALVQLLQSTTVDDFTRRQAASSLGEILQNNKHRFEVVKALSGYSQLDDNYYDLAWKCAQNMPYPDFYQAWHQHNVATGVIQSLKKILFTRII